jgi:2-methylcitrate dehydratase PrpD
LARGKITLDDFDTTALDREDIALLMPKVHMRPWAGEEESGLAEVVLTDGTRFTVTRDVPRGSPGDPASWADIFAKLQDAQARARNRAQAPLATLFASLQSMETQSQFSDLL